jgi:glycosyltransferase involved in cell wall biosynthesis
MEFSIILPTLNEKGHILKLIESIKKNFKNKKFKFEIIIVDDNSTDGTIQIIKKNKKRYKKIKLFIRKIYSALSKFNKLKLEVTSKRKIKSKIRIDKYKS